MPATDRPGFFGRNASVFLDLVRFAAACAVAITHLQSRIVSPAAGNLEPVWSGNFAVCVFFVLSGFVIRFVTVSRVATLPDYWIDRASRLYSVVAPALLLTVVFTAAALLIDAPALRIAAEPFGWASAPQQLLSNLTFTVGYWGYGQIPLSNGPFWSLPFECVYYVLYGLLHYRARLRWLLIPLILFIVGPSIAALFLIWLLGALLYDVYARLHTQRSGVGIALAAAATGMTTFFLLRHSIHRLLLATNLEARRALVARFTDIFRVRPFFGAQAPWLDRLSVSFFFTGLATALVFLALLPVLDRYVRPLPAKLARKIRFVADSTFTLYLVHLPLFDLVYAIHGRAFVSWRAGLVLLAAAIAFSVGLAALFDRLKNTMRRRIRDYFQLA